MGGMRAMEVIEGFPFGQFFRQIRIILVVGQLVEYSEPLFRYAVHTKMPDKTSTNTGCVDWGWTGGLRARGKIPCPKRRVRNEIIQYWPRPYRLV